jgi:hypothetical protein
MALMAAGLAAGLGALIMGEYQLAGVTGVVASALLGLAVAEIALTAGGAGARGLAFPVAALASGAVAWGGWIAAGRDVDYVPRAVWVGVPLAAVAAAWWLRRGSSPARPDDS